MDNERLIYQLKQRDLTDPQNLSYLLDMAKNTGDVSLMLDVKKIAGENAKLFIDEGFKAGKFRELYKDSIFAAAPSDFDSYLLALEWYREPDKRFYIPRRRKIRHLVQALQDLLDDKLDLLSISMPPGTGKSTLELFFVSMFMGKFPDKCNLMSGHAGILTRGFYDGVLSILTDDTEYAFHEIFPQAQIVSENTKETTIDLNSPKRFKTLTCRAIDATLTGATRCEGILCVDDLVSGIEEAMNPSRLDTLWNKYVNDLKSRKKLGAKELHIATRWSVHDPIGRLQVMYDGDPRAKFIAEPALNENDESNFDYDFGVGFDTKYFLDMRNSLDDVSWKSLFQNEPIEREGLLYPEDELRRYYELPDEEPEAIIGVCDTKDTGSDYAFLPVAYKYGDDYYIDDCVCDNSPPDVTDARCAEILLRDKVHMCRFESNSAGGRIADKIQDILKEKGGKTHITKRFTTANKETKIIVNAPFVKEHFLFKDKSKYSPKSDYGRMMTMLCRHTLVGKNKNDDVPDGMAMLAIYVQSFTTGKATVFQRPF